MSTEAELGAAWDRGYASGVHVGEWGYDHKPRNPYTGEMNDDIDDYCPEHGGTADPRWCDDDSHPAPPPPPPCTCDAGDFIWFAFAHEKTCPQYIRPLSWSFPVIQVPRGGIKFGGQK